MAEADYFTFASARESASVEVELSYTERLQLRVLAVDGGPLDRIVVGCVELKKQMGMALVGADLNSVEGIAKARQLQAEMLAVDWTIRMWERMLSLPPTTEPTNDSPEQADHE